jgi:hypothetical protein
MPDYSYLQGNIASVRSYCTFIQYHGFRSVIEKKRHDDAVLGQNR